MAVRVAKTHTCGGFEDTRTRDSSLGKSPFLARSIQDTAGDNVRHGVKVAQFKEET